MIWGIRIAVVPLPSKQTASGQHRHTLPCVYIGVLNNKRTIFDNSIKNFYNIIYLRRITMIGIYKIRNTINNKVYIGQSVNIAAR